MDPKMIAKQIIEIDKAAFDGTFNAISSLQVHSEKMINLFLERANFLPPEGKRMMREWTDAYEKSKNEFKKSVDDSFETMEHFLVGSADIANFSSFAQMKKTTQSAKKVVSDIKESIQPEAAAVEKAEMQESSLPQMVEEAEKRDSIPSPMITEDSNVLLKAINARKAAKPGKNKK